MPTARPLEAVDSAAKLHPQKSGAWAAAHRDAASEHRASTLELVGHGERSFISKEQTFQDTEEETVESDLHSSTAHTDERDDFTAAEVALAFQCHGAHLSQLAADVTPAGSHYLLVHFDVPVIDEGEYLLRVHGSHVAKEMRLDMDTIRARPKTTHQVMMECAGSGRTMLKKRYFQHVPWGMQAFGCSRWGGCSLAALLAEAGVLDGAKHVIFTGADKGIQGGEMQYYQRSLPIEDALLPEMMVVWEMNGAPLLPCHGAPLRLIVPGWYGMASVKWLTSIEVTDKEWWGYQMGAYSYARYHNDPQAIPMRHINVRALMVPPGSPDFFTRVRFVEPGRHTIQGKAWAGAVDIAKVEFSDDGGNTWRQAELGPKLGAFAWAKWSIEWDAEPGRHVLVVRATDANGHTQDVPSEDQFNYYSMGCTQPQRVPIEVTAAVEKASDGTACATGGQVDLSEAQLALKPRNGPPFLPKQPAGTWLETLTRCHGR